MRWSDNKGWLPFAVIVLIAAFAQPAFLFFAWKFDVAPAQITTANDLASIMGAIFTAGGLVVALVSIYTMANVETVTKNAVKPLLDAVPQDRFPYQAFLGSL